MNHNLKNHKGVIWNFLILPAILCLLSSNIASAETIYPEDGWWRNQDTSGRGYVLERQGDIVFLSSFHYAPDGSPDWLVAVGPYTGEENPGEKEYIGEVSAQVYRNYDGQCIGCDYVKPTEVVSEHSPLTIQFTSNQTAVLNWPGESVEISRFFWSWDDALGQLDGQWMLVSNQSDLSLTQLVSIYSGSDSAEVADTDGLPIATIERDPDGGLSWTDLVTAETIPVLAPETRRFYAGAMDPDGLQVLAVRVDDLPFAISNKDTVTETDPLSLFSSNVVIATAGDTLTITTNDLPDHNSPYWGSGHDMYEAPHAGMVVNPNRIQEQDITFRIPTNPELATQTTDTGLGPIGVSVNGVVFFNQYAGIDRTSGEYLPLDNEIATFDLYNGHPQQTGQYHYHLEPFYLTIEDTASLIGFAMDGFPVYGPDNADGSPPQLDECNGETHVTAEYPEGSYHYHASNSPPYLIGCFKGTPGTVSQ